MTTAADLSAETAVSEYQDDALYAVDEQAYEEAGEAYLFKVWQRLCWSGECRLCRRFPDGKPLVPGNTTVNSIYSAARTCSNKVKDPFISPGMSLLEAVFRILIANGNAPMRFDDIVGKLQGFWGAEFPQRIESLGSLQRVLDGENEYRIGRASNPD